MNIRPSEAQDKQFLIDVFEEEGILSGFPMTGKLEIEDSCQFWTEMALKGYGLSVEIDGIVVGMAVLYIPIYKKLEKAALFSIVVHKDYRRKNVASTLIEALEQLGTKKYGLTIIHLEVYEKNFGAIKLYQKLGYKEYGIQKNFIKDSGNTLVKSSWKNVSNGPYNLEEIFDRLNLQFFNSRLETKITWARQGTSQARCYRRLGCFMPTKNLIKIHPLLNDDEVPDYFISYIVYHEMLHAVYPPIKIGTRRYIHHKKFNEMERAFPDYEKAKLWEKTEGRKKFF